MSNIRFTWNPRKAELNFRKHGVSFAEAKTAFFDDGGLLESDPDHSEADEDRFVLLGLSISSNVLVVCHCYRGEVETIRIISARRATSREMQVYWGAQ